MSASAHIRRYIHALLERQLFATRDLLSFGSRTAIDNELSRLVKRGRIVRLTSGIYMKGDDTTPRPSIDEITAAKANAFGKVVAIHGDDLLRQLRIDAPQSNSNEMKFWVVGSSSSFKIGDQKIVLRSVSTRKMNLLKEGGPALSFVALWHLGRKKVTRAEIQMSAVHNNHQKQKLMQSLNSIPNWLSNFYKH